MAEAMKGVGEVVETGGHGVTTGMGPGDEGGGVLGGLKGAPLYGAR